MMTRDLTGAATRQRRDRPGRRLWMRRPCRAALAAGLMLIAATASPAAGQTYDARDLTIEQIRGAVDRGVEALLKFQPNYTFAASHHLHAHNQAVINQTGNHSVALWALLQSGKSYQEAEIYRRMNWVLSSDSSYTYDRAMRMNMLSSLPRARWRPWIVRDGFWLANAVTSQGNFADQWGGGVASGFGDNAHGQYGVLGLFGAERAGYAISRDLWQRIDNYWREAQASTPEGQPAGWGIYSPKMELRGERANATFNQRISGPMTAGGVAVLSITERMLYGPRMVKPGEIHVSTHLRKGVAWLDNHFQLEDAAEQSDLYYYYWTIQQVGNAIGYRSFNQVDWYREITAKMLNDQRADGTWHGPKGPLLSTSFALLYLGRAYDPLAVSKIRFVTRGQAGRELDTSWNNRPHDLWNFVDYASDEYEYACTWQIVELFQPVYSLIESPVLFLGTHAPFEFSKVEIDNLRGYINAGGLLMINPDSSYGAIRNSVEALAKALYPNLELERVPTDHPVYNLHQHMGDTPPPMMMLHNGVRPLMFALNRDIGEDLQKNQVARSDSFPLMSNIYLFATGMNPRRSRLENNHVPEFTARPTRELKAARLQHSGRFDPEPGALSQLRNILGRRHNINLNLASLKGAQLTGDHQLAFLTTLGDGSLSDGDAGAIRKWLEAGGTLWIDAIGGSAQGGRAAEAMIQQIIPDATLAPLPPTTSILQHDLGHDNRFVQYRAFMLRTSGPMNAPKLQAVMVNDRPAIIYSAEDITSGLAGLDHWGIFGYTAEHARNLVVNSVLEVAERP